MKYNLKKTDIYYKKRGEGKVVILVHGFLENHKMWDGLVEKLKNNHEVIVLDLLGHGKSDGLCDIHTMEQQAKVIKDLMNRLGIIQATLVGHSMGGYVSLAFAELFPEKLSGLVLLNSHPFSDNEEKKTVRERAITTIQKNYLAYIKASIPSFFAPENRTKYKRQINKLIDEASSMKPQDIIAALKGMMMRKNQSDILCTQTGYPKMWIVSKKDPLIDIENILELAHNCKTVDYIELSEGHMSYIENAKEMPEIIKKFLKRNNI